MYFPYLRGKQFELIALREISEIMANKIESISPIIEPVKNSSTLKSTLLELRNKNINFNIIINPSVGDLKNSSGTVLDVIQEQLNGFSNYQIAIIVNEKTNVPEMLNILRERDIEFAGITLIHEAVTNVSAIIDFTDDFSFIINVIYFQKTSRRYNREFDRNTWVGLEDFFITQLKNVDYLAVEDSQFSEEHLYYQQDGFKGFSDFLTIGDNYSETGFLPYAVAIHLSYADNDNKIRIKHFVSDSNDDASDIGGKFAEALEKLVTWCEENNIPDTIAILQFKELYRTGHFPGLGSIKKLSIMHHIELVLNLI
ncbi:MAG TPA: sce7725 family protein [Saprospiraceae bacterium]|nr:sce7725 family protein [Saprospiraceae bacterium]